ncbi:MAG TPA: hypothetical protein PLO51_01235 [Candidatus Micrarchaeota archaeon]|nr:hypothetical protein [Candidatus Micrarchaeota archaeon]
MVSRKSAKKPVKKSAKAMDECSCDNHLHMDKEMKQGYTVFGLLIAVLGLVWLANDIGWMPVGFSVGPVVVIILGLALIFTCIEARD